jgi:4-oxalocrotonate tautomerase family enzyme
MPFVNMKLIKNQVSPHQKKQLIEGVTDLIVNIMGRDRLSTVITIDELNEDQWAIGGHTMDEEVNKNRIVSFVNIKVSKGTTTPEEIDIMMSATKELFKKVLGNSDEKNYFIMDELNSYGWGLDGLSMAARSKIQ